MIVLSPSCTIEAKVPITYTGSKGITQRRKDLSITDEKSFIRFLSVSPSLFEVSALAPSPIIKAKTTADSTSKNGGIEIEKKGSRAVLLSAAASIELLFPTINGKRLSAMKNEAIPAIKEEQ